MTKTETPAPGRAKDRRTHSPGGAVRTPAGGGAPVRVLVVFESRYRSYGDAIARAIRELRPGVEVELAEPADLRTEVARFSPHLVISSQPNTADPAHTPAWVQLPHEPALAGKICSDGRCLEVHDVGLKDLLEVVDRTGARFRA